MFWQAGRKLFLPSPDSPSAAPWLRAEPAAGSLSCQTHQYSTRLECADRDREKKKKIKEAGMRAGWGEEVVFSVQLQSVVCFIECDKI